MKKRYMRPANPAATRQARKRTHAETEDDEANQEETIQEQDKSGDFMDQDMEIDQEPFKTMSTDSSPKTTRSECVSLRSPDQSIQSCESMVSNIDYDSKNAVILSETSTELCKSVNIASSPGDGDFMSTTHQHDVNNNSGFAESKDDDDHVGREQYKVIAVENSRHSFGNELEDHGGRTDEMRECQSGDGESSLDNEDSNVEGTVVRINLHGTDVDPSYQQDVVVGQDRDVKNQHQEDQPVTYGQTDIPPTQQPCQGGILDAPAQTSPTRCEESALIQQYQEQQNRAASVQSSGTGSHEETTNMSVSNQGSSDNRCYKEDAEETRTNFAGILTLPSSRTSKNADDHEGSGSMREQSQTQYSGQSYDHLVMQQESGSQQGYLASASYAGGNINPSHSQADGDLNDCPIAAEQLASELVKTYSGPNSHMISEILTQDGARQFVCDGNQQNQPQQFVPDSLQQTDQPQQFPCSGDHPEESQQLARGGEQQNQPQQLAHIEHQQHQQQQQQFVSEGIQPVDSQQFVCEDNRPAETQQFVCEGNQPGQVPQQQYVCEGGQPVETQQFVCDGFEQQSQGGLSEYAGASQTELHDVDLLNTPQQLPVEDVLYPHQAAARAYVQTGHPASKSVPQFGSPQACSTPDRFRSTLRFDQRIESPCPETAGYRNRQPQMFQGFPGPLSPDIMSLGPNNRNYSVSNSKPSPSLPYELNQFHEDHRAGQFRKEFSPQLEGMPFYNEQGGSGMLSALRSPSGNSDQGIGEFPRLAGGETKMTFTPRVMMTSRLSQSNQYQKQHAAAPHQAMSEMDYSSIYPRKDFIEKTAGMKLPCQIPGQLPGQLPSNPGQKPGSYDHNPPPKKRHRMSRNSSPRNPQSPLQPPQPPAMPLIDDMIARYPPTFPRDADQANHKYFVVNPSDATTMTSKNLLCKYIDFLILENEQITEISKSLSPPVDIYVTEDMYFMDSLRYRVPFPSQKFTEWVSSFYPRLQFWEMEFKGVRPQPATEAMLKMVDSRQIQQMLEDTFYFFQREVMNVVSLVEGST